MNNKSVNPSILFYEAYQNEILKTRKSLFGELKKVSPAFAIEAKKLLEKKLSSNNNTPLLGELFPWIIKDLVKADTLKTHNISIGWLAIYLYTLFLDEHVDNPAPINPTKFLMGSLLAKTGLLSLSRYTINTPYETYIDKAFSFSAKNQELDTKFQSQKSKIDFKESYSEGKNYIVLACAGALAAQNSEHSTFITQFTEKLLLTLQYLDDLADFKEDFNNNNFTVLLSEAFHEEKSFLKTVNQYSSNELLAELIQTGALERVVQKVINFLDQSIILINNNGIGRDSASVNFFYTLRFQCAQLMKSLKSTESNFKSMPHQNQSMILDRIENQIAIIAQSS